MMLSVLFSSDYTTFFSSMYFTSVYIELCSKCIISGVTFSF